MGTGKECDLCSLGCGKFPIRHHIGDADRFFCCSGCMNVYLILWESGAIQAGQDIRHTELFQRSLQLGLISTPVTADNLPDSVFPDREGSEEMLLHISGMWCTSCAWLIEHAVTALPGVANAQASFASDLLKVRYQPQALPRERIFERIHALGYEARDAEETGNENAEGRDLLIRTGLAAFLWVNIMSFSLVLYAGYFEQISGSVRRGLPFVLMAMATPVVFYCGYPILRLAWRGLLNRTIRMELLLALGILSAYGYSVAQTFRGEIHLYFDTATIIVTLVLAGKLIERGAKEKASRWISGLHRMMPNKVRLLAQGLERFVSIEALEPGTIFVVKAGERVPADGIVVEGESHADESLLTGESAPIDKDVGAAVAAGSINLDGILQIRATKSANDSTLSRILALVEQALTSRCDLERAVDRVSRVFVPSVVFIAILTFLLPWWFGHADLVHSLMRAITVLVIACPCALGLATPLAITAAFGSASRRGILVRDTRVLETLPKIDTLILDKTGTVTTGTFSLLKITSCGALRPEPVLAGAVANVLLMPDQENSDPADTDEEIDEALSFLASLEQYSEHPLGVAVTNFCRQRGTIVHDAQSVEIHKGRGVIGVVHGKKVFAGNRRLAYEQGVLIAAEFERQARDWEEEGKTVCFLGWDDEIRALAVFGDKLRPESLDFVSQLQRRGIEVRLVSGDARATTKWAAHRLGIDCYESEVSPEQKSESVRRLQETGAAVAMVGDGINDSPALAQADLGIAMGSGTDIAMKAAAVVLMNSSLYKILDVIELSHKTMRIVRQNLFWAFFYNVLGISLAVVGILNPIMAACAMLLSSLSVVGNSMRLARADLLRS